ncbi:MAG: GAF domain-containing protein [Cyclobacteriaceae bacterium]|nr:GAF domain-containing protein [Cyclobacteriaceae bacterium SS2]
METLNLIQTDSREEQYKSLVPQIKALIADEPDLIANLANISAALKTGLDFYWIGFYLVKNNELVLGPFQGPIACTRIGKGKGVCGSVWEKEQTFIVPDVDQFPGHIACSSASRSEIVIPLMNNGEVMGVLDIDSDKLNDFSEVDEQYLKQILEGLQW